MTLNVMKSLSLALSVFLLSTSAMGSSSALAQVPSTIAYQGLLTDASDVPVADARPIR